MSKKKPRPIEFTEEDFEKFDQIVYAIESLKYFNKLKNDNEGTDTGDVSLTSFINIIQAIAWEFYSEIDDRMNKAKERTGEGEQ